MGRIYLVGLPGSGKSTLGKELAIALNYSFLDLDAAIEKVHGTIPDIFKRKGEDYFREIERETLILTLLKEDLVVACGGGTPCFYNNMEWMNWNGKTVYLERNIEAIIAVSALNRGLRPMFLDLGESEIHSKLKELQGKREEFYRNSKIIYGTNQHFKNSLNTDIQEITSLLRQESS